MLRHVRVFTFKNAATPALIVNPEKNERPFDLVHPVSPGAQPTETTLEKSE